MICPNCGFVQPDDFFCARCGVHIEKHTRRQRKKQLIRFFLIALLAAGALLVWRALIPFEPHDTMALKSAPSPQGQTSALISPRTRQNRRPARPEPSRSPDPAIPPEEHHAEPLPSAAARQDAPPEQERTLKSARDWLERGAALDDDSDEEIQCYLKALDLDGDMAPAHFRLGAIYYRRAAFDTANQEFTQFLRLASEADRRQYDIHQYYSSAEIEDLESSAVQNDSDVEAAVLGDGSEFSKPSADAVRFTLIDDHMIVPVRLNGDVAANMILDTGSAITIVSFALASSLDLSVDAATVRLKTLAGEIDAPAAILETVECGVLRRENVSVAVADLDVGQEPFDGVLGLDVLENHDMQIDGKNRLINFVRP